MSPKLRNYDFLSAVQQYMIRSSNMKNMAFKLSIGLGNSVFREEENVSNYLKSLKPPVLYLIACLQLDPVKNGRNDEIHIIFLKRLLLFSKQ